MWIISGQVQIGRAVITQRERGREKKGGGCQTKVKDKGKMERRWRKEGGRGEI